jgi:hypothetical protein
VQYRNTKHKTFCLTLSFLFWKALRKNTFKRLQLFVKHFVCSFIRRIKLMFFLKRLSILIRRKKPFLHFKLLSSEKRGRKNERSLISRNGTLYFLPKSLLQNFWGFNFNEFWVFFVCLSVSLVSFGNGKKRCSNFFLLQLFQTS